MRDLEFGPARSPPQYFSSIRSVFGSFGVILLSDPNPYTATGTAASFMRTPIVQRPHPGLAVPGTGTVLAVESVHGG